MIRRKFLQVAAAIIVAVSPFAIESRSQTSPGPIGDLKIENFGRMDEKYYRGAQPSAEDFKALAALGVKTVIDLRNDPVSYEKSSAEAAGLKYVNIPMSAWRAPRDADMERFLQVVDDPESGTVYVHCKQGKHRTGVASAIYRMSKYGWDWDKTYQEMKNYHFYTGLFHSSLKNYAHEFAVKNNLDDAAKKAVPAPAAEPAH
jgi:tyrosine-protein phosphatase SIW14